MGGGVIGSTSQLLQATAVNVIQSYGAQQIKLLADSLNSEAARTTYGTVNKIISGLSSKLR